MISKIPPARPAVFLWARRPPAARLLPAGRSHRFPPAEKGSIINVGVIEKTTASTFFSKKKLSMAVISFTIKATKPNRSEVYHTHEQLY